MHFNELCVCGLFFFFNFSRLSHRLRSLPNMIFKSLFVEITSVIEIKFKINKNY